MSRRPDAGVVASRKRQRMKRRRDKPKRPERVKGRRGRRHAVADVHLSEREQRVALEWHDRP